MTIDQLRAIRPELAAKLEGKPMVAVAKGPWSAAEPTVIPWIKGMRRFASKTEARVAARLLMEARATKSLIFCQVRIPLLSLTPRDVGTPASFTCDFVLVGPDGRERWIDAKTARKSPEWLRGKLAAQKWLGQEIEETDH